MTLFESHLPLPLVARGKVRDLYQVDDDHLLLVATDRLSAFDVVLPNPIPEKGATLTRLSCFWFEQMGDIVANHLQRATRNWDSLPFIDPNLIPRAVIAKKCRPLPVEAIVRSYLIGSGWRDYVRTGAIGGLSLPPNLQLAEALSQPIFTPSTKAPVGTHDENISFDQLVVQIGAPFAEQIRHLALQIYERAATYALTRGVIIADTKMEFGVDEQGELVLIDELLTPDSSRFWPVRDYEVGKNPPSFDKQFVRDYLDTLDWNKQAPAPSLPPEIIQQTTARYLEAQKRLMAP